MYFFLRVARAPIGPGPPHCRGFTIKIRHDIIGRTPLDAWSARRIDLCLTKHNDHNRQTSMPPGWIRNPNPASEWPQIHTLDRAATVSGIHRQNQHFLFCSLVCRVLSYAASVSEHITLHYSYLTVMNNYV